MKRTPYHTQVELPKNRPPTIEESYIVFQYGRMYGQLIANQHATRGLWWHITDPDKLLAYARATARRLVADFQEQGEAAGGINWRVYRNWSVALAEEIAVGFVWGYREGLGELCVLPMNQWVAAHTKTSLLIKMWAREDRKAKLAEKKAA